jgi:hypothetical protein
MKSRIIQREPDPAPAPSAEPEADVPAGGHRKTWLRRWLFLVAVAGYIVLGLVHPADLKVGDDTTLYLWIHIVQPILILLLAWGLWLLVEDLPGRAAQAARLAIVPYAIAYATLDAVAGIATGMVVREANRMSAAEGAIVQRVWDDADAVTNAFSAGVYLAAGVAWLTAAVAVAVAIKQVGGLGPTLLMAIGAAVFAVGHPFPPGPIGIALFGLGVAWLEVRRHAATAPAAQPVLAP